MPGAERSAAIGLPGLQALRDDLAAALDDGRPAVFVLFDLVGFKRYNDAYGYACGDALLRRLARRLERAVGDDAALYRARGDEFALLASGSRATTEPIRERAAAALCDVGEGFVLGCAHGVVELPAGARSASEALKLADQQLHEERTTLRAAPSASRAVAEPTAPLHITELALAIGRRLGLGDGDLEELECAVHLRDVGMMALPDEIRTSSRALGAEEAHHVRLHPLVGERLLRANFGMDRIATIVRSSHERWDGTGYPDGLAGDEIPLAARIVFVCGAFQDMTTPSAHRRALTPGQATHELLAEAGTQFDPAVIDTFLAVIAQRSAAAAADRAEVPGSA